MTFKENMVVVVKVNGKILREQDGTVTLPFGSEYSLQLKNLNSRRAIINISIDGKDVLNGKRLVIEPNSDYFLEGFLDGFKVKNKFKFINKTKEIVEHRGDRIDDGIIRVEYQFEVAVESRKIIHEIYEERRWPKYGCDYYCYPNYQPVIWYNYNTTGAFSSGSSAGAFSGGSSSGAIQTNSVYTGSAIGSSAKLPEINPDEGITVPGSESSQMFVPGYIGTLETNSHVIILKLRGSTSSGVEVSKAITVKTKSTCPTCGKKSKSYSKFCSRCGTSLS